MAAHRLGTWVGFRVCVRFCESVRMNSTLLLLRLCVYNEALGMELDSSSRGRDIAKLLNCFKNKYSQLGGTISLSLLEFKILTVN